MVQSGCGFRISSKSFGVPKHSELDLVPDGSAVLDCLAYGISKLVEENKVGDVILLDEHSPKLLDELDARIFQVAYSSKHWVIYPGMGFGQCLCPEDYRGVKTR